MLQLLIKMIKRIAIIFIFIFSSLEFAQNGTSRLVIVGDSLKGKIVQGESIREVIGNVIITQEDIKITCKKAIQYIRKNSALLVGGVVLTQDSVVIKTERGNYFGDQKIAESDTNVYLKNGNTNLYANSGQYDLNSKIADFKGDVLFYDSVSTLKSSNLIYDKNLEKIIATGNVDVSDSVSNIRADSLIHFRNSKYTKGFGNIIIKNVENNVTISGDSLIDDKQNKISKIFGNPFLTQIEKLNDGTFDTLFIQSRYMEANQDSNSRLTAIDSVRIIRGDFLSNNDYTIYDRKKDIITILKQKDKKTPILWYENTQVTGDSIFINLDSNRVKRVDILNNSLLISEDSTYKFRYNQMSGDSTALEFNKGNLSLTEVKGNVLSIYYMFEDKDPNGLLKSSANEIKIYFEDNRVSEVKMYGSPVSEFHPENLVKGHEKDFTLPTFVIYNNKPNKKNFTEIFTKLNIDKND